MTKFYITLILIVLNTIGLNAKEKCIFSEKAKASLKKVATPENTLSEPNCLESDSLVLVALYNTTNGPNWYNSWNLSQPVYTWHGITTSGCYVTRIDLPSNNLSGAIPTTIGNLQNLSHLNLNTNNLWGEIPAEIGNLQNLKRLALYENGLSGEIPSEIGNLQNLNDLVLDTNGLTGSIPAEIGNLQNLINLYLYDNKLSGVIPTTIGNLLNLEKLNLSKNTLTGLIPVEIGNLQYLEYFDLYTNKLTGAIPAELGNLQNLLVLGLYDNSLSGEIPSEIGNLENLTILYLDTNDLTGEIPTEIGNLQNLVFLYLFGNNLSGCYPVSLCSLSFDLPETSNYFDCTGNSGLPENGSDQGFVDFCDGTSPCSTEVYPGDLNFDGIADYKDILAFGLYNDESGPARALAYQDINWSGHPSIDWGATQENSADLKHIDADGNGFVDLDDVEAIEANYGRTHNASNIIPLPNPPTTNPILDISLVANDGIPCFIGGDDKLVLDIQLESVLGSGLDLYGGYFTISFEDSDLVINDIEVEFPQSWFGTPNQDFIYIDTIDLINRRIDIGITKINHLNSIGEGTIGQIITSIDNDSPWDTIALGFVIEEIFMQNSEEVPFPITGFTEAHFAIPRTPCYSSINITSDTPLSNHAAQTLIQTTGSISINPNDDITFGSDRLKVNNSLTVESGGEFTYCNEDCGTSNRSADSSQSKSIKPNQLFNSGSYKIIEDHLVFNLDLIKEGKISFEVLDNSNNSHVFEFGERDKGTQEINIPLEDLPTDKFYACLKVGADRYYFEVSLQS